MKKRILKTLSDRYIIHSKELKESKDDVDIWEVKYRTRGGELLSIPVKVTHKDKVITEVNFWGKYMTALSVAALVEVVKEYKLYREEG